tara:strand:+ start:12500 stop:13429 length:930 start_codon:yes stop_codon:yes gene_type:complete
MKRVIQQYFSIHRIRFERASLEFGLDSLVSYLFLLILFVGLSFVWMSKGKLTQWTYICPPTFVLFFISHPDRLQFYKQIYSEYTYSTIRWIENFMIVIPFLLFMLVNSLFLPFIALLSITIILSLKDRKLLTSIVLPTPFYRFPFEFTSGFRYSWILIIGLYALTIISCWVSNEALAIFSVLTLALTSILYYQNPETEYFIWIHNMDSKTFIIHKIKIAICYTLLIIIPMFILVVVMWPSYLLLTVSGVLSALMFLATLIAAKYTMYPQLFNLPLVLALLLGLVAPPLLLILFPILYNKAIKNLKPILS